MKGVAKGTKEVHRIASEQIDQFVEKKQLKEASWDYKFAKSQKAGARKRRPSFSVGLVEGVPVHQGLGGKTPLLPQGMVMSVVDGVPVALSDSQLSQHSAHQAPVGAPVASADFQTDDV